MIGGWLPGGPHGNTLRAVLAGAEAAPGRLQYVGSVGTGFTGAERRALAATLRRLAAPASPPPRRRSPPVAGPWGCRPAPK
ncbi:hypothetical protein ACFXPX_36545 [Kitasatospora sp. NPDC059146]|uniref:ATP dependent DNA ligase n=1 Tax=unclassified Kitasatospora TaxID=2633591 RepID=UPI0036CBC54E